MSAIELFHQDGKAAGVFYCSECRAVNSTKIGADRCHGEAFCAKCGAKVRYGVVCSDCQHADFKIKEAAREAERFEKASKIPPDDYDGYVYYDAGPHDGYFDSWDEFEEWAEENYTDRSHWPEYVWACNDIGLRKASVSDITENILDGMWEDADEDDLIGIMELAAAIDAFNEANKGISFYQPDYTRAILVPQPDASA